MWIWPFLIQTQLFSIDVEKPLDILPVGANATLAFAEIGIGKLPFADFLNVVQDLLRLKWKMLLDP
jgi:hypothetical protein